MLKRDEESTGSAREPQLHEVRGMKVSPVNRFRGGRATTSMCSTRMSWMKIEEMGNQIVTVMAALGVDLGERRDRKHSFQDAVDTGDSSSSFGLVSVYPVGVWAERTIGEDKNEPLEELLFYYPSRAQVAHVPLHRVQDVLQEKLPKMR